MEAMRVLKRRLSDVVYRQLVNDARNVERGQGGHVTPRSGLIVANPRMIGGCYDL